VNTIAKDKNSPGAAIAMATSSGGYERKYTPFYYCIDLKLNRSNKADAVLKKKSLVLNGEYETSF
jgi:hypothetical protein